MSLFIVYPNDSGGIVAVMPSPTCGLTIQQIALKDVPYGKPFCYVDQETLPSDFTFSDAWEMDFSTPDGYGADYGVGSTNAVVGWNVDGSPILRSEA